MKFIAGRSWDTGIPFNTWIFFCTCSTVFSCGEGCWLFSTVAEAVTIQPASKVRNKTAKTDNRVRNAARRPADILNCPFETSVLLREATWWNRGSQQL